MSEPSAVEWFDRPGGEPVELHQPSPAWARLAKEWQAAIRQALAPSRARVEHVGSTAVPGLVAKPVVDLQVSVSDVEDEASYRPGLESLGLVLRTREPGHRFFRPPAGQPRTVHVHVCEQNSDWEHRHLVFRNELRTNPEIASAYARLKQELARQVGSDRFAYTDGKNDFIQDIVETASRRAQP